MLPASAAPAGGSAGRWAAARQRDGDGNSDIDAIACATASHCIAGGDYEHNGKLSPYAFLSLER